MRLLECPRPGDVEFLVGARPPCGSLDTSGRADLEMRAVKASRSTSIPGHQLGRSSWSPVLGPGTGLGQHTGAHAPW